MTMEDRGVGADKEGRIGMTGTMGTVRATRSNGSVATTRATRGSMTSVQARASNDVAMMMAACLALLKPLCERWRETANELDHQWDFETLEYR